MSSLLSYLDRKNPKPNTVEQGAAPPSPHTPQRPISSTFSSPGTYRSEEDVVILSVGSRFLRVGLAGESAPRCVLGFGPEMSHREGDFLRFSQYPVSDTKLTRARDWGKKHEFWQMSIADIDLKLLGDKFERVVREAYTKYILLESKSTRAVLVVPSIFPKPLLSILLNVLFNFFQIPSVTLLSDAATAVSAAGLRSAVVVDIGWHETIITSVYEFRELHQARTNRAMKRAGLATANSINAYLDSNRDQNTAQYEERNEGVELIDPEHTEEIMIHMAWCRNRHRSGHNHVVTRETSNSTPEGKQSNGGGSTEGANGVESRVDIDRLVSIPWPKRISPNIKVPFSLFCEPVEDTFFQREHEPSSELDDHEHNLAQLLWEALVKLPPDIRGVCVSRIVLTGGGANIPGLRERLLTTLAEIVQRHGWSSVRGKAVDGRLAKMKDVAQTPQGFSPPAPATPTTGGPKLTLERQYSYSSNAPMTPAGLRGQVPDQIEKRIREKGLAAQQQQQPPTNGLIRAVATLGSWAGASLLSASRVRGIVDVEREAWMQHGFAGARRLEEVHAESRKQGIGIDKSPWTLGQWY